MSLVPENPLLIVVRILKNELIQKLVIYEFLKKNLCMPCLLGMRKYEVLVVPGSMSIGTYGV